jgi:Pentapeptide repeats (9 copies)
VFERGYFQRAFGGKGIVMARTNQLISRWTDAEIIPLRRYLPLEGMPRIGPTIVIPRNLCGTIERDGRCYVDLRGFPLAKVAYVIDSGIDFSFAKSPKTEYGVDAEIRLTLSELSDRLFDDAKTFQHVDGTYKRCSFLRARMREAGVGARFEACLFDEANLRGAKCDGSSFVDCSFRNADLLKSGLGRVTFERCDFRGARLGGGAILGTRFLGCNLEGVDLGDSFRDEATLFDLECNLEGVRYADVRKLFGQAMKVGPAPVKRAAPTAV